MKPRLIFTSMFSWGICALLACVTASRAVAEDLPKSCQETTERVLKPFLDQLAAAEEAARQYEKQNADNIASIQEQIRLRQESKKVFDDARAKEDEDFGNRIRWGNEAIAEAQADAQKRIAEQRRLAAEARAAGRERDAKAHADAAAQIAAELAAGKISWYKRELGLRSDINGWREYVAKQAQDRAQRMAAYDAGEVAHYIQTLGWRGTWKDVLAGIASKQEDLAKAQRREYAYYLPAIGTRLTGQGIDDHLALRQEELADARARIAAGTFVVYVPALGTRIDRNGVQDIVAEAREKYRKTVNAWAEKTYSNYNPLAGSRPANGDIEKAIEQRRQELADFQAAGDDARAYAAGAYRMGRDIRQQIAAAQGRGDTAGYNQGHEILAAWKKACAEWIARKQEEIRHWEAVLAKHEEVHKEDLKNQKANIDGRLQDALNQTPCGGEGETGDPDLDIINRHRDKLDGLSESDEERQRRRDWYDDKIHVERDGTVHGDPCDAWRSALRDTGLSGPKPQTFGEWLLSLQSILGTKDFTDWLSAFREANQMREATNTIDEFIEAMQKIDINKMTRADFYKKRREIRQMLVKMSEALENGMLSPSRLRQYIDALARTGSGTRQTGDQIRALNRLLEMSKDAKNMWRSSSAIWNVGHELGDDVVRSYRAFVSGSATEVAQRLDSHFAKMSKLDKGLLLLSVAAATAEAVERMNQGEAPSEAIARSSVNFVIDLAIAGIPITAAAEMTTQILFNTYAYTTGDEVVAEAVLSNTSKWVAQQALNQVADGAAYLGEASIALERIVFNEPNVGEILGNVSSERLRQSLSRVEDQLDALPPGHADEARLMRMRETFRILIRAKQQEG